MFLKFIMGGGALLVAVLITLTQYMGWDDSLSKIGWTVPLNYIWAALVFIWGIVSFK